MSPEQGRDSTKVDHRCDLWAVAIIAYECLLGERPYEADSLPELAVRLLTGDPPIPSEHGQIPAGFDAWFGRATAREPQRRYASAADLADALADALEQPRPARSAQPGRRRSSALLAAAAGIAMAGTVWGLWPDSDSPAETEAPRSTPTDLPTDEPGVAPPQGSSAPPSDEAMPRPKTIELRLGGVPPGAVLWRGNARLGTTPGPVALEHGERPSRIRIEAPGFEPLELEVVPDRDQSHTVELTAKSPPPTPSARTSPAPRRPIPASRTSSSERVTSALGAPAGRISQRGSPLLEVVRGRLEQAHRAPQPSHSLAQSLLRAPQPTANPGLRQAQHLGHLGAGEPLPQVELQGDLVVQRDRPQGLEQEPLVDLLGDDRAGEGARSIALMLVKSIRSSLRRRRRNSL